VEVSASQIRQAGLTEIDKKLIEAVQAGDTEGVKAIINSGVNVNARTEFGETPLHLAQARNIADLLISKGADIHAKDDGFGMTPLFNAPVEISKLLVSKGADVNAKGKNGVTPLAWAVYWDAIEKIEFLISKEADVNAGDEDLKTPLQIASNWNKAEIAKILISNGAKVNAKDRSGWTVLHWASFEGGVEVVQLLIAKGAEKNVKTTNSWGIFPAGSTPLDIAEKVHFYEMAGFLKSKGCKQGKDVK
jgi:ankyrin repeat protein